jgi:hypothetical protein
MKELIGGAMKLKKSEDWRGMMGCLRRAFYFLPAEYYEGDSSICFNVPKKWGKERVAKPKGGTR